MSPNLTLAIVAGALVACGVYLITGGLGGIALGLVVQFRGAHVVHLEVFGPSHPTQSTPAITEAQT